MLVKTSLLGFSCAFLSAMDNNYWTILTVGLVTLVCLCVTFNTLQSTVSINSYGAFS